MLTGEEQGKRGRKENFRKKGLERNLNKDKELNGKTTWRLLIGVAQSDMKWYYTEEEFEEMFKKY